MNENENTKLKIDALPREYSIIRHDVRCTIAAGVSVPLHSHDDAESFYVLSGEAQVLTQTTAGLEWRTIRRADFVHIPDGTKHAWRNVAAFRAEQYRSICAADSFL
jgi:mannose-6-phosphate isomerase-like protein (cupin superfamily)